MNAEWIEIEELVRQAQAGDRDAFGQLFVRFQGAVYAVARRRQRDADEADELVQEVFLHAMRKIVQLREPAAFGAWLQRITHRVAINRATRKPPLATAEAEMLEAGSAPRDREREAATPLDDLMRNEEADNLRAAVASLKQIDRDVLRAFYLQHQSLAEIAEAFEVPIGTVKRRLHVARHRLEEALGQAAAAEPANMAGPPGPQTANSARTVTSKPRLAVPSKPRQERASKAERRKLLLVN